MYFYAIKWCDFMEKYQNYVSRDYPGEGSLGGSLFTEDDCNRGVVTFDDKWKPAG